MTKRTEINDFKFRAYRTENLGDQKFQNWRTASTVTLQLVVEIDGIEIAIVGETFPHTMWERAIEKFGKKDTV